MEISLFLNQLFEMVTVQWKHIVIKLERDHLANEYHLMLCIQQEFEFAMVWIFPAEEFCFFE